MLDKYKDGQPIAYRILKNAIKSNKISHAYLIDTNGYSNGFDLAVSFAKSLLCLKGYTDASKCVKCTQCKKIDDGNFTELRIINPDGLWIKKEQLLSLQNEFSKKAVIGHRKIYIINGAEFLNSSSANSILKFLEEPEENITAILLTDNVNRVIETILSRCQIITLSPRCIESEFFGTSHKLASHILSNDVEINEFIGDSKSDEKIDGILKFIKYYEKNSIATILFIKNLWFDHFNDKEKNILAYKIVILFYKDVLNYKCGRKIEVFSDYSDIIKEVSLINSIEKLCFKLDKFIAAYDKTYYNININLIMDKLIMELEVGK